MIDLTRTTAYLVPFHMGIATEVFAPDIYAEMVRTFPPVSLASQIEDGGKSNKLSLTPRMNEQGFNDFVAQYPVWSEFNEYIKKFGRFEFSFLSAAGGYLFPHRDAHDKFFSMVVPMIAPGEWQPAWGGNTLFLKLKVQDRGDYAHNFSDFDVIREGPFLPNVANFFTRSQFSWHAVRPIHGPADVWRRSITINLLRGQSGNY